MPTCTPTNGNHSPAGSDLARDCYTCCTSRLSTIAHRDLRNNSAEALRAVRDGETLQVTNHGEVVAVLSPPPAAPLDGIRHRPPLIRGGFSDLPLFPVAVSTESVLEELRAER